MKTSSSKARPAPALASAEPFALDHPDDSVWGIEIVTPARARAALESVIERNRNLDRPTVHSYARDMKGGHWKITGDPIRFNKQGQLMDGQHRMTACIEAGVPFTTMVGRNLPDDLVNVIDSGRKRRPGDILAMRGIAQAHLTSAACRWLVVMGRLMRGETRASAFGRVTHEEVLSMYDRHQLLSETTRLITNKSRGIRPSLLTVVHYLGKNKLGKAELAQAFMLTFVTGQSYYAEQDPALRLREKSLRMTQRGQSFDDPTALGTVVSAWNAYQARRPLRAIAPAEPPFIDGLTVDMILG